MPRRPRPARTPPTSCSSASTPSSSPGSPPTSPSTATLRATWIRRRSNRSNSSRIGPASASRVGPKRPRHGPRPSSTAGPAARTPPRPSPCSPAPPPPRRRRCRSRSGRRGATWARPRAAKASAGPASWRRLPGSHGHYGLSEVPSLATATDRPALREIVIADVLNPEHPWGDQIPTGSELLSGSPFVAARRDRRRAWSRPLHPVRRLRVDGVADRPHPAAGPPADGRVRRLRRTRGRSRPRRCRLAVAAEPRGDRTGQREPRRAQRTRTRPVRSDRQVRRLGVGAR